MAVAVEEPSLQNADVRENEEEIFKNYFRFESDGKYEIVEVDYVIDGYLDVGLEAD